MSSLQSARTQKPDTFSTTLGLGYESLKFTNSKKDDTTSTEVKDAIEEIKVPIIEGSARYGVMPRFDVGGKVTLPGSIGIDGKYMLLGMDGPFAMSTGATLGYSSIKFGTGDDTSETILIDTGVPLYFTYDVTENIGLHLTPKVLVRTARITNPGEAETSSTTTLIGSAAGANIGWFFAEYAFFKSTKEASAGINQVMIGFSTAGDNLERPSSNNKRKAKSDSETL
jgi:hypothetical protein